MIRPYEPGDRVWLVPRTAAAPRICYQTPRATVRRVDGPYVVVTVNRREVRVHFDNVTRTDPGRSHGVRRLIPKQRPPMPTGFTEVTLW